MAKNIYVGDSNNIARKVNKIYIGDSNNVARKVLKGYVGDSNNVARQFYESYTRLNYIKGTGTQYINSGITPDETMEIEAEYRMANFTLNTNNYVFGTKKPSSTPGAEDTCRCQFTHRDRWLCGFGDSYQYPVSSSTIKNYVVKLDKGKFYVDNNLIVDISASASEFTNSLNIYIMASNDNNTALSISNTTIYYLKIKKNNVLVRDFIPVKRNSDNAIGLLDLVENKFYGNAGTGTFLYG